jgi:hypothetical protein
MPSGWGKAGARREVSGEKLALVLDNVSVSFRLNATGMKTGAEGLPMQSKTHPLEMRQQR